MKLFYKRVRNELLLLLLLSSLFLWLRFEVEDFSSTIFYTLLSLYFIPTHIQSIRRTTSYRWLSIYTIMNNKGIFTKQWNRKYYTTFWTFLIFYYVTSITRQKRIFRSSKRKERKSKKMIIKKWIPTQIVSSSYLYIWCMV